jgi:hypothetical protein
MAASDVEAGEWFDKPIRLLFASRAPPRRRPLACAAVLD